MIKKVDRNKARCARHTRVRNKVTGTSNVPRLNVFRSNSNICGTKSTISIIF